jgi:hypothetical protein
MTQDELFGALTQQGALDPPWVGIRQDRRDLTTGARQPYLLITKASSETKGRLLANPPRTQPRAPGMCLSTAVLSGSQISPWLRAEYPVRSVWHMCHETIYQALYLGRKGGLCRALTAKLRTGRPRRKRRRRATERTPRYVAPAVLIHRPAADRRNPQRHR